jgi:hypothetical protein
MRSFDQPLHIGLAALLVGGVVLFDAASDRLWAARNKGKGFQDAVAAARQQREAAAPQAAAATGSGGGGGGGSSGGGGGSSGGSGGGGRVAAVDVTGGRPPPRSAWLDGMRGRDVGRDTDVDRGGVLRASPPGQMRGHAGQ